MTQRSVAVQGIGFGALAVATMGLLGGTPEPVATPGTITIVDVGEYAEARIVEIGQTPWT